MVSTSNTHSVLINSARVSYQSATMVIKLMQSFKFKEYVRETFAWMHYYWYLTNDGIRFLRTYLNLPSEIVAATLKKSARPAGRPLGVSGDDRPRGPARFEDERPMFGDSDGYRAVPPGGEKGEVRTKREKGSGQSLLFAMVHLHYNTCLEA